MAPPVCFSDLPPEALDDIARRAGALNNVVCSAVCRPWRRALKTTRLGLLKQPNRPYSVNLELWCGSIELHPIRRCINGERTVRIANHDGAAPVTRIVGSSHGWLVTVDEDGGLSLLEAVTGRLYPLPPITSSGSKKVAKDLDQMGESMFQKAELVPGHRLGTFAVMLIHGGGFGMSFLRPGAKCWTAVRVPKWMKQKFVDVVFHQGAFYTVSRDAEVSAWTPDASRSRGRSARGSPSWCRSAAATCSWCLGCTSARGRGSPWRTSGRRPSWWGAAAA
ncbi:Os01g0942100 [Oryza sativa Japonica Group]|uniref:Os01g0942100 protein n=2 Tax=Oryza TaxID=4527 RepID=A0A0P0VCV0_ORYSJ|nr:F-box domain-containing protein [Oryza sativa Japonica Group]BAS76162.1 Os01g0942100 [Oryza sativa Japonica Group]